MQRWFRKTYRHLISLYRDLLRSLSLRPIRTITHRVAQSTLHLLRRAVSRSPYDLDVSAASRP